MKNKLLISVFIGLIFSITAYPQRPKNCINDGPLANCSQSTNQNTKAVTSNAVAQVATTSPIPLPKASDRQFNKNTEIEQLDQYLCRTHSPITVNIPITRVINKIDREYSPNEYLANIQAQKFNGNLSDLKIRLPVFDIDPTEVDTVYFNGHSIGNLHGRPNDWEENEFSVPISQVKFGTYAGLGNAPLAGNNELRIDIDTTSAGWCTSIDWINLSFETMSPIVLIHGNGSDHGFFQRRGLLGGLEAKTLLVDSSLDLPVPGNYIYQIENSVDQIPNDRRIQAYLRQVSYSYGVDSMHIVTHSKGGLDTRAYLANYYLEDIDDFKILSYISLSTPHNGSLLADLAAKYSDGIKQTARSPSVVGLTNFQNLLGIINNYSSGGYHKGTENLTTNYVSDFNQINIPRLKETGREIDYYTIASDADRDGNGSINPNNYPIFCGEEDGLFSEAIIRSLPNCVGTAGSADAMYQILKTNKSIEITFTTRTEDNVQYYVPLITGIKDSTFQLNDTLVTVPSGTGVGSIFPLVPEFRRKIFKGPNTSQGHGDGKNHATVADQSAAFYVNLWTKITESNKGDLAIPR